MKKLSLHDVGRLEQYLQQRTAIRRSIIEHKKCRRLALGPNATLHFEDYLTMKYQVQEMMRVEKLNDAAAIQHEIDTYNPLIPEGRNLACTLMLEFPDPDERHQQLRKLLGVEQSVFIQIGGHCAIAPIADDDALRHTQEKTSALHFLRYEFTDEMIAAAKNGAKWAIFCDHPQYSHSVMPVPDHVRVALLRDFD
jgi:hypothetical protein